MFSYNLLVTCKTFFFLSACSIRQIDRVLIHTFCHRLYEPRHEMGCLPSHMTAFKSCRSGLLYYFPNDHTVSVLSLICGIRTGKAYDTKRIFVCVTHKTDMIAGCYPLSCM